MGLVRWRIWDNPHCKLSSQCQQVISEWVGTSLGPVPMLELRTVYKETPRRLDSQFNSPLLHHTQGLWRDVTESEGTSQKVYPCPRAHVCPTLTQDSASLSEISWPGWVAYENTELQASSSDCWVRTEKACTYWSSASTYQLHRWRTLF